jgi:hypothetical protein
MAASSGFRWSPGHAASGNMLRSHRHTAMAIEIAREGGAFVRRRRLFWQLYL